jgi:hypothetical protein
MPIVHRSPQMEGTVSGFQLSGDAPTAYTRFALKIVEPWTADLILSAGCRDGDRVLDVCLRHRSGGQPG